jgi:hypothetical protein
LEDAEEMATLPQALALQAADGWDIPNSLEASPSSGSVELAEREYKRFTAATGTMRLSRPSGRYNCFGLVFGSRRVNINSTVPVDIDELLRHDLCQQVQVPRLGDLVAYRGRDGIEHVGFVSRIDKLTSGGTTLARPVVFVWSMWGSFGEFEHRERVLPPPYEDCSIEYWRVTR